MREHTAAWNCLSDNYPEQYILDSVNYPKLCSVLLGKACGYNVSDDAIAACMKGYYDAAAEYLQCAAFAASYYTCLAGAEVNDCTKEDPASCQCLKDLNACDSEFENYKDCLSSKYSVVY